MTREEAKKLLPVIKAFADGKTIQFKCGKYYDWEDVREDANTSIFLDGRPWKYRIKPEPKYRPFKTKEECWEEMHKHSDFGWLIYVNQGNFAHIISVFPRTILFSEEIEYSYENAFKYYNFTDGTPFGMKEE